MIWESWGFSRFRVLNVVHPWWWYPALLSDFIFYVRWGCLIPWTTETAKIVIQYFSFLIWLNLLPILLEEAALVDKAHLDLQLNPPAPCLCLSAEKNASKILAATTTKKVNKGKKCCFCLLGSTKLFVLSSRACPQHQIFIQIHQHIYVLSHRIIREGRKTDYLTGTERNIILAGWLWEELLWLLWSPPTPFKHSFNLLKVLDLKAILPISSSTHRLLSSFKIQKSRAALKVLVRDLSSKGQRKLWKLILYKSHQLA